jgi:hypothetical protein
MDLLKRALRIATFIAVALLLLLMLTNPSENAFLQKISEDYGAQHGGWSLDADDLTKIGSGERTTYFVLSTYSYEFGKISVTYLGIMGSVYFIDSDSNRSRPKDDERTI